MDTKQLRLSDGRLLGYTEFGDPGGRPLFYFHGFPGSRLDWLLFDVDDSAADLGIRIVAADRPGMGYSHPLRGRRLLHWSADVTVLADELGIDRFSVIGISGGGPYALACASSIPERLESATVVCGMGPPEAPGARDGMSWALPGKGWLPRCMMLLRMYAGLRVNPEGFVSRIRDFLPERDRDVLAHPGAAAAFAAMITEAFRPGTSGICREAAVYSRPWDFDPGEIPVPVHLWHGELDRNVPVSVCRFLGDSLPGCRLHILPEEAHLSLPYYHIREILEDSRTGREEDRESDTERMAAEGE
jgi:pimeloyl-ACP methyl ester carboxylesterase